MLRRSYRDGFSHYQAFGNREPVRVNLEIASSIVKNARQYPLWLVQQAETRLRSEIASSAVAVGEIASSAPWFPGGVV